MTTLKVIPSAQVNYDFLTKELPRLISEGVSPINLIRVLEYRMSKMETPAVLVKEVHDHKLREVFHGLGHVRIGSTETSNYGGLKTDVYLRTMSATVNNESADVGVRVTTVKGVTDKATVVVNSTLYLAAGGLIKDNEESLRNNTLSELKIALEGTEMGHWGQVDPERYEYWARHNLSYKVL